MTLAAIDPPRRIAYHMDEPAASVDIEYRLTPSATGTSVVVAIKFTLEGLLRLMTLFARTFVRAKMQSRLALRRGAAEAHYR